MIGDAGLTVSVRGVHCDAIGVNFRADLVVILEEVIGKTPLAFLCAGVFLVISITF